MSDRPGVETDTIVSGLMGVVDVIGVTAPLNGGPDVSSRQP
jgi:hypothetical protein